MAEPESQNTTDSGLNLTGSSAALGLSNIGGKIETKSDLEDARKLLPKKVAASVTADNTQEKVTIRNEKIVEQIKKVTRDSTVTQEDVISKLDRSQTLINQLQSIVGANFRGPLSQQQFDDVKQAISDFPADLTIDTVTDELREYLDGLFRFRSNNLDDRYNRLSADERVEVDDVLSGQNTSPEAGSVASDLLDFAEEDRKYAVLTEEKAEALNSIFRSRLPGKRPQGYRDEEKQRV